MIAKATLGLVLVSLVISLITMNRVFGLRALMRWELSNLEKIVKDRVDGFLDVFRRSRNQ